MSLQESLEVFSAVLQGSLTFAILPVQISPCFQQDEGCFAMLVLACQVPNDIVIIDKVTRMSSRNTVYLDRPLLSFFSFPQ